jgi:hypothetical protein
MYGDEIQVYSMNWTARANRRQKLDIENYLQLRDEEALNHCSGELGGCSCVIRMGVGWNWA